ncbi:AAA family ATPase [bacterium]|nr:AAA family ATPase [bacterium]
MTKTNIVDARKLLGDLVKGAPSGHPLNGLSVAEIKQGKSGWNGSAVWPVFESIAPILGALSREDAVEDVRARLDHGHTVPAVLDILSEASWPSPLDGSPDAGIIPATTPATPAPPKGSTAAMRAMLETFTNHAVEAGQAEAQAIMDLQDDLAALAKKVGTELGAVKKAAATSGGGGMDVAAVRGLVASLLKEAKPEEKKAAKAKLAELPPVPDACGLYVKPSWHDDVAGFITADKHGVIGGSSGCGKTYPLKQICSELGRPCKLIAANENLDAETLVALPQIKGGTSSYSDGPLVHAMRHGYVLLIDEGDQLRQGEAIVLNDALESRRITIPQTGEVVEAKAGFCCWFTSNAIGDDLGIYNREGFDESMRQRLLAILASPLTVAQEVKVLCKLESPSGDKLATDEAELLVKWAHAARPLHFGIGGAEPVLEGLPSTRVLVSAVEIWLGFNRQTGAAFKPAKAKGGDVRSALWYPFAATRSAEEVRALKAANLWVW